MREGGGANWRGVNWWIYGKPPANSLNIPSIRDDGSFVLLSKRGKIKNNVFKRGIIVFKEGKIKLLELSYRKSLIFYIL